MSEKGLVVVEKIRDLKHASIALVPADPSVLLITAETRYIPIEQFKSIFQEAATIIQQHKIKKLIFDKRNLNVFHQPSMEWYFVEWKSQMFELGLSRHVKLLPVDAVFRESVKIGRRKINEAYPNEKFHALEIHYAESLEEAISL